MLGNVWEPCLDELPPYKLVDQKDPVGEIQPAWGIMRGGSWLFDPADCRAATRIATHEYFGGMGVRIVINPEDNRATRDKRP